MQSDHSGSERHTGASESPADGPPAGRRTQLASSGRGRGRPAGAEPRRRSETRTAGAALAATSGRNQADSPGIPRLCTLVVEQQMDPPVVTVQLELPFDALAWENFERLCLRLARSRSLLSSFSGMTCRPPFVPAASGIPIRSASCNCPAPASTPKGDCNFNGVTPDKRGDTSDRHDNHPGPGHREALSG
jgi:hypothetical protein